MQYNDGTNLQGIKQDMYFILGSNNGTAPDDYTSNDQKRNINNWYRRAVHHILQSSGDWKFSDTTGSVNLVSGTRSYQLSAAGFFNVNIAKVIRITRVEVSYDGSNWYRATPLDESAVQKSINDATVDGTVGFTSTNPFYVLRDDYIDLYPEPTSNVTGGLKIWYVVDITDLSSDTDIPKVPALYHRYIALGAAYDYAFSRGLPNAGAIRQEMELYVKELRQHMANRNTDQQLTVTARYKNYN